MSPRTRTAALAATAVLTLSGLAACGSDEESAQDPAGETSTSPVPEESTTPAEPSSSPTETFTETPSEAPTDGGVEEAALPACAEVWVAGATVPGGYEGCLDGERTVPADGRYCEFGKPLFTYGRDLWAVAGGPVNVSERPLLRDPGYRKALKQCGG